MATSLTAGILLSAKACIIREFRAPSSFTERDLSDAPKGRSFRISLQTKLLGVILLCALVPVLGMAVYLLRVNQKTLGEKAAERLGSHLLRKGVEIDLWMGERLKEAARWSASFVVYEGLESLRGPGASPRVQKDLVDYLMSLLGHYRVYESLFIVDPQGTVLAATRDERLEDWVLALFPATPSSTTAIVSPIRLSTFLGRPTMVILQPVSAPGTEGRGRLLGYFVQRLDVREIETLLGAEATAVTPAAWLLDGRGAVVAQAGKIVADPGSTPFAVPLSDATEAVMESRMNGASTVIALRRIDPPVTGYLAATVESSIAYGALRRSQEKLVASGLAAIFAIILVGYLASRGILRPISLLSQGAKRVAGGDLDVYLPVRGRDEIADLTLAFNDMANKIREGRERLEAAHDELARTNEGLKGANRALETLAITDGLTSLFNHRHFQDSLERELRRSEQQGRPLSLLLLDIDHFKMFNDRWGHQEGDAALRRVAAQVMKGIRPADMAFRYGGEELAVLMPSCAKEQAGEAAEKLRLAVREQAQKPGRFGDRLTVSLGVACFPEDGAGPRALVDAADAALYAAKAQGRDRVVVSMADAEAKKETAG
jgi:diguanylate cyclase (GGDEF)-like protein